MSSHTDALRLHEHIQRGLVWLVEAERSRIFVERERAKLDDLLEPPELFDNATPEEEE